MSHLDAIPLWAAIPAAFFLVLGFYPKPALDVINPAVEKTLVHVGVEDPAPTQATSGSER